MFKRAFVAMAFFVLVFSGTANAQNYRLNLEPRYLSVGSSIGAPAGVNLSTAIHFSNYAMRLSGIYTGSNEGAPNGAELAFLIKIFEGSNFTHSVFHMVGYGQSGHSVSNLQVYMGYGYNVEWKNLFAEVRVPIFFKNNGGYTGIFNYFKIGYMHSFR